VVPAVDGAVRAAAFAFLEQQSLAWPNAIPWRVLLTGFELDGRRVPLASQQGIFKPAACRLPLSIRTAPLVEGRDRPYDDALSADGLLVYRYRGEDRRHPENEGLREAWRTRTPLVYLFGVQPGWYVPEWPVFIEHDDPASRAFTVSVGERAIDLSGPIDLASLHHEDAGVRRYATRTTMVRLHQKSFSVRVIAAYRERCAICRLRHAELLDAAHILPDTHPRGRPVVPNGLALCKLHHAAFDAHVIGVTPDLKVEVRVDVLEEEDGPMLQHGLQGFHRAALWLPRAVGLRPDREYVAERYEMFRNAS
jgi:putative restriction endonuclease